MNEQEKNIYKKMKGKTFIHTPAFDFEHLRETGVDVELDLIFEIVGSRSFWNITELGSKLLTI